MSEIKKTLQAIAIGTSIIGLAGCTYEGESFSGKIGNERVKCYSLSLGIEKRKNAYAIEVIKPNGKRIIYSDYNCDLKIDCVTIHPAGDIRSRYYYPENAFDKLVIEEAQKQFDEYLKIILPQIQQKELKDLK